jgi:hypothetical protein
VIWDHPSSRRIDGVRSTTLEVCGQGGGENILAVDLKVNAWLLIWNFKYEALHRKVEDKSVKFLKEISIVDRGGGRRTIDLVLIGKRQSPEENQGR